MQFRKIGQLDVSTIGLGCSNFGRALDEPQSIELVKSAVDLGVNFFDSANVYNAGLSEEFLGKALEGRRDEVVVATKFGKYREPGAATDSVDAGRGQIRQAVEDSLQRLRTDRIDLYILHVPDPNTPIATTLAALDELIEEGKVLEIGCSSVDVSFLEEAAKAAEENGFRSFVNVQNRYNLLEGERESETGVIQLCEESGIAYVPWSPLASGMLSGKYRRGEPLAAGSRLATRPIGEYTPEYILAEHFFDAVERLTAYAEAHGHTVLDLAFAGLLARPVFASVIAGATSPAQLAANVRGADWILSADERNEVLKLVELAD
jgi:aryl-alcohol dehydrogenase-like predicted oxidoreductase